MKADSVTVIKHTDGSWTVIPLKGTDPLGGFLLHRHYPSNVNIAAIIADCLTFYSVAAGNVNQTSD